MLYDGKEVTFGDWDETERLMRSNQERLDECDRSAKAAGRIVGRIVEERYADGYAVYQVVEELGDQVRIRVCKGLGDDWEIPYWGEEALVPRGYAEHSIERRDALQEHYRRLPGN